MSVFEIFLFFFLTKRNCVKGNDSIPCMDHRHEALQQHFVLEPGEMFCTLCWNLGKCFAFCAGTWGNVLLFVLEPGEMFCTLCWNLGKCFAICAGTWGNVLLLVLEPAKNDTKKSKTCKNLLRFVLEPTEMFCFLLNRAFRIVVKLTCSKQTLLLAKMNHVIHLAGFIYYKFNYKSKDSKVILGSL